MRRQHATQAGRQARWCSHPSWLRQVTAALIRIPSIKHKLRSHSVMFFWISFHYEPFPRKCKHKQVCTSHIWKYDHLWHFWPKCENEETYSVTNSNLWPSQMSKIGHKFGVIGTNPFTFTFGNPDQDGSQYMYADESQNMCVSQCLYLVFTCVYLSLSTCLYLCVCVCVRVCVRVRKCMYEWIRNIWKFVSIDINVM